MPILDELFNSEVDIFKLHRTITPVQRVTSQLAASRVDEKHKDGLLYCTFCCVM
jgi:hypothetical protein